MATRQGRHKGAGKGTYTSCSEGGGSARGGLPTPLSGAWGILRTHTGDVGPTGPHHTTHILSHPRGFLLTAPGCLPPAPAQPKPSDSRLARSWLRRCGVRPGHRASPDALAATG
eukprot:scaffold34141_cov90-Isochrysis_galbana.AAC.2